MTYVLNRYPTKSISHIIAGIVTTMNQFPPPSLALDSGVPGMAYGLSIWSTRQSRRQHHPPSPTDYVSRRPPSARALRSRGR